MSTAQRAAGPDQPILQVQELVKAFGSRRGKSRPNVLRGVSFDVKRGETLALVGESGSGKSTTARCIVRLTDPSSGRVLFNGVDLAGLNGRALRQQRRNLQMVFQDPASSLDSRMTVLQSVQEPLEVHRIGDGEQRRRRALEALERVGLVERLVDSKPHMLSGGQQQRAAIARALVTEPDLIILDEPVSALDVSVRAQVLNLLKELQRDLGLSYLFIVHDLAIAEYFSDRVIVLYGGQIMEAGSSKELFRAPSHPYTEALLSAVPVPDPRVVSTGPPPIARETVSGELPATGCAFSARCGLRKQRSVCLEQVPPPISVGADHVTACHFHHELRSSAVAG